MKKKETTPIFDVHTDSELEALAKAFVQAAHARKMTSTQAGAIIAQIWRENIYTPQKREKLLKMPLEEPAETKAFREKVRKFVGHYPQLTLWYAKYPNNSFYREYTINILCAIHKMFVEEDYITSTSLERYLRDYFRQTNGERFYYDYNRIHWFPKSLLETAGELIFKTTGEYAELGTAREVDKTFLPVFSNEEPTEKNMVRIDFLSEPRQKRNEYDCRMNPTIISIINMIWVIETFF